MSRELKVYQKQAQSSLNNIDAYGDILNLSSSKDEYKHFNDRTEADKWGISIYSDWSRRYKSIVKTAKELSPKIKSIPQSALECYCGYSFREINTYMRGCDSVDEQYKEAADILAFTIASAPRIPENIVVYRGVCDEFIQELIRENKRGIPVVEKGFLSTSLLNNISKADGQFAASQYLLKIYVPKGTFGIYVNAVTRRDEYEMLIAPNSYLRLVEYPYEDSNLNKWIFECSLLSLTL